MDLKRIIKAGLQTLIVCLFFGWTIIAVAGGSIYPPINQIAKPFVCPTGDLKFGQRVYRPSPGTTVTTTTWVCSDTRSGGEKVINVMELTIPAGMIYGLIAFVPIMAIVAVRQYRQEKYPRLEKAELIRQGELETRKRMELEDPVKKPQVVFDSQEILSAENNVHLTGGKVKDAAEELGNLKQLLNQGLITQQDYDQKKREILTRL
jgi:hypothetical protein